MPAAVRANDVKQARRLGWLRVFVRLAAILMAAAHTAAAVLQQSMNEDGISYLDMGDEYLDGHWTAAINRIWSPFYGLLIAFFVRVAEPSAWWEFPTVQITNFAIFVAALFTFEYFWRRLTAVYYRDAGDGVSRFPPALWLLLGYSLFIWSSLELIQIWAVTPDMCVAIIVYLTAGRMLQIVESPVNVLRFVVAGLLLGFGYLVKGALLPLGLVAVVIMALGTNGSPRDRVRCFTIAVAAMLVGAAPLLLALSWVTGEPTTGDVGRFVYLKHVNEMPYPDFHSAVDRLNGTPAHPPRRLFENPPIYEFAQPVAGTYPMAYDPGYWTKGLEPEVSLPAQARALATSAMAYFDLFVRRQGPFLSLVLLLGVLSIRRPWREWRLDGPAALVLWSLAAFGMYAIVNVLPRYVAPFVVLFWSGLLACLRFPSAAAGNPAAAGAALLTFFVWVNLGASNLDGLARLTGFTPLSENAAQPAREESNTNSVSHPAVAEELTRMGLRAGDHVAFIGYSYSQYWARLSRVRIVAEIHWHDVPRFWNSDPQQRSAALDAFRSIGAVAVIASPEGLDRVPDGWQAVGDTGYVLFPLNQRLARLSRPELPSGAGRNH